MSPGVALAEMYESLGVFHYLCAVILNRNDEAVEMSFFPFKKKKRNHLSFKEMLNEKQMALGDCK